MPFSDRVVLKVKKFFLILSRGPPCGFNRTHLDSGLESPGPSLPQCCVGVQWPFSFWINNAAPSCLP